MKTKGEPEDTTNRHSLYTLQERFTFRSVFFNLWLAIARPATGKLPFMGDLYPNPCVHRLSACSLITWQLRCQEGSIEACA